MADDSHTASGGSRLITMFQLMVVVLLWNGAYKGARVLNTLYALELGATPFQIGLLLATYGVFPLLLAVYAGRIADRYGVRVPILFGVTVCLLGTLMPAYAPSLLLLFAAVSVTGLGFILSQVAMQSLVGFIGKTESHGGNFSLYALVIAVADLIGPVVAGFAIDHLGHAQAYLILGVMCAAALVTLFVFARLLPRHHHPAPRPAGQRMSDIFRDADMRRVLIASAVVMTAIDLFQLYLPLYGHQVGLSASAIGMVLGASAAAAFVSRALLPWLIKKFGEEPTLLWSLFGTAAMFAVIPFFTSALMLGAICFVLGLGMGLGQPLTVTLCYRFAPQGRAGESLGLRIAINNSMHVIVPAVFGAAGAVLGLGPVFWVNAGVIAAGNWYARRRNPA